MANIKSSKKRIVQNAKRSELNKNIKSRIRSSIKKIESGTLDKNNNTPATINSRVAKKIKYIN